jgi:hypothetical protein
MEFLASNDGDGQGQNSASAMGIARGGIPLLDTAKGSKDNGQWRAV